MELLYFILGVIFISLILPCLEGLCSLFLTQIESKKAKSAKIINQINKEMVQEEQSENSSPSITSSIGYCLVEEGEDEEDEI